MGKHIDMVGKEYGRWVVISLAGRDVRGVIMWNCRCSCGTERPVSGLNLRRGSTKSCGCFHSEISSNYSKTHGMSWSRTYNSWVRMRHVAKSKGVGIDSSWSKFENFYKDMGDRPETLSLMRINIKDGFSLLNCRWALSGRRNVDAST